MKQFPDGTEMEVRAKWVAGRDPFGPYYGGWLEEADRSSAIRADSIWLQPNMLVSFTATLDTRNGERVLTNYYGGADYTYPPADFVPPPSLGMINRSMAFH